MQGKKQKFNKDWLTDPYASYFAEKVVLKDEVGKDYL